MPAHLDVMDRVLYRRLWRSAATYRFSPELVERLPVTDDDIAELPAPAQRYLRFMRVIGKPPVWSFRARFEGRFRMRPGQRWMPCRAWQYNFAPHPARLFHMQVNLTGFIPTIGADTYASGSGRMHGRLLGLVTVADGAGPEFDIGELTTYLNDALLLAPSMLLGRSVSWKAIDDSSFTVSLTDREHTVGGVVTVDGDGRLLDFRTDDRFCALPTGLVRATWSTPVDAWNVDGERPIPTHAQATWHLPDGPFTYADGRFDPATIEFDVVPRAPMHRRNRRQAALNAAVGIAQIAGAIVASPLLRERYNRWGATPAEVEASMPGDELVPLAKMTSTRAVTIDAPPAAVWPWLAQIGQGRGGFYSFDELENLAGCNMHSAEAIRPHDQFPVAGDLIRLGPDRYPRYRVAHVERGHSLLLLSSDDGQGHSADGTRAVEPRATWQWQLEPADGGNRCRLLVRQRIVYPRSQSALWRLVEPVNFVMERQMLLGIRERAERRRPSNNSEARS